MVIRRADDYLLHAQVTLAPVTNVESRGDGRGRGRGEIIHYVAVLRSLR